MCLNSHRRGVSLDSADKGQVPLLTQRDEHWGEGDGGQEENSWTLRVRVVMVVMVKPASLCRG